MLCRNRDDRASRAGICVDECVSGNFRLVEPVHDISRRIESSAVSVHFENDRGSFVALGCFHCTPQKRQERRRNFTAQRDDNDIAFVNRLARMCSCGCERQHRSTKRGDLHRHSERSKAKARNPVATPESNAARSLDFARDDRGRISFPPFETQPHRVSLASLSNSNEAKIIRRGWERSLRRQSSKSPPRTTSLK